MSASALSDTTSQYTAASLPWPGGNISLSGLSDNVDQCRLASLVDVNGAAERRSEIFWIGNGALPMNAHTSCNACVVDVGILDLSADSRVRDATLMPVGHTLDMHHLLMIRAVVVHYAEQ